MRRNRTSCRSPLANQMRLMLHTAALLASAGSPRCDAPAAAVRIKETASPEGRGQGRCRRPRRSNDVRGVAREIVCRVIETGTSEQDVARQTLTAHNAFLENELKRVERHNLNILEEMIVLKKAAAKRR
jgi:hypothetical protein